MITPEEAADALLGTCQSLSSVCTQGEDDDLKWCEDFDERITNCDCCGWWVEASEVDGDNNCEQCAEEQLDEDG